MKPPNSSSAAILGWSAVHFLCAVLAVVFLAEAGVMFVLPLLVPGDAPAWVEAFADASMLAVSSAPILWYVVIRPLKQIAIQEQSLSDSVLRTIIDAVVVTDDRGIIRSCNPASEAMFGHSRDTLRGQSVSVLVPPPHRNKHDAYIEQARLSGMFSIVDLKREVLAARADGSCFPAELTVSEIPLVGERRFVAVVSDLSQRRLAERRYRSILEGTARSTGDDFFAALAERLTDAFSVEHAFVAEIRPDDPQRVHTLAVHSNGAAIANFEYDLAGTPCEDALRMDTCFHAQGVADRYPRDAMLRDMGAQSYLGVSLRNAQGSQVGLLGVIGTSPMQQHGDNAAVLSVFARRAAAEIERQRELVARRMIELELRATMDRLVQERTRVAEYATELKLANAELTRGSEEGAVRERELSQLFESAAKQADELAAATADAKAAARAKSDFLANMSHEIRTPMTAILGYTDLLLEDRDISRNTERRVEVIQTIRRNGQYLLAIINDILDLSKIEAGKFQVERLACSPHEILRDVEELMQVRADAKGLVWRVELDGSLPVCIQTDSTRLRQILINLVSNAIKFTEVGTVRLVARTIESERSNCLAFDVIDTGIGMTTEQCQRLFQPFQQADSSMSRKFGGTGLGLTISKRFAELLGGDIHVRSKPGEGSTFTVTIDAGSLEGVAMIDALESRKIAAAAQGPARRSEAPLEKLRVLLVEDGPDNQRLIAFLLKKAGAAVAIAENGLIGRDLALEAAALGQPFDVIVMDMQMPVMDGYTATRELRSQDYRAPIVALTAHAMAEERQRCLDAGCDGFATKPIDRERLIETVRSFAGASRIDATAR